MKVLITTDLYTTDTNGVVTSVKNLSEELVAKGHEVRILTLSDEMHSYRIGNVFYIRSIPLGAIYPDVRMAVSYRHRLIRQIVEWKPDVIHSQCEFFSFQFAEYIAKETGAPIVHTYHTLYEQYVNYVLPIKGVGEKAVGKLSQLRLKHVRRIIAPTRKVEERLREYGIEVPIAVVPSGIRLEQHEMRFDEQQRTEGRKALGIEETDKVLVNIGRLGTEKRVDELLKYFSHVTAEAENMKFLIVGDGPAKEDLEKQAAELGLGNRVIFTGMVPPASVQEYYQLGDVFVSASTSETQGLTYVEAAANGLPLLCRRDPCLNGILEIGENGYDFTDEETFAKGLQAILGDDEWRQTAAKRSETLAAAYGKESFATAIEEVYRTVVEEAAAEGMMV